MLISKVLANVVLSIYSCPVWLLSHKLTTDIGGPFTCMSVYTLLGNILLTRMYNNYYADLVIFIKTNILCQVPTSIFCVVSLYLFYTLENSVVIALVSIHTVFICDIIASP